MRTTVPETTQLRLLGVLFDSQLSFKSHIRQLSVRGAQRLGFLKKAAKVMDSRCRTIAYKGFVRPVLEYSMLVWMGAAPSILDRLSVIQRRALRTIGEGAYLDSLEIRRLVGALSFLYKLHYIERPAMVRALLPPPAAPSQYTGTRRNTALLSRHDYQLAPTAPRKSRNTVLRSFPDAVLEEWNRLPSAILQCPPSPRGLQTFKTKVYRHLRQTNWSWATDRA